MGTPLTFGTPVPVGPTRKHHWCGAARSESSRTLSFWAPAAFS